MKKINLLLIAFNFCLGTGFAQICVEKQKIVASDRTSSDYFGIRTLIEQDMVFVGAYEEDHDPNGGSTKSNAGSVYLYEYDGNTWSESYKLQRSDRDYGDRFGKEMNIEQGVLAVSAPSKRKDNKYNVGAVYIYNKNTSGIWEEKQILRPNTIRPYGRFGIDIALQGNTLVAGTELGNANVFEFNSSASMWEFKQELTNSDAVSDWCAVAVNGNYIALGSYEYDEGGISKAGACYIYKKDGNGNWLQIQKILSPLGAQAEYYFGKEVYLHNDFLFVCSVFKQKAFVYKFNSVSEQYEYKQTLGGDPGFGGVIAFENNLALIGAHASSYNASGGDYKPSAGAFYIYTLNDQQLWERKQKVLHSDRDNVNWFGCGLDISNGRVVSGAPYQDKDENNANHIEKAGAAYVFEIDESLSIPENEETNFLMFPNPSEGIIQFKSKEKIKQIQVYNFQGKCVHTTNKVDQLIDLGHIPSGMYLVKIESKMGRLLYQKLIIK